MQPLPVALDTLIAHVESGEPTGGPLAQLVEAVALAQRLHDQGDELVGHFVEQARRSGASWAQVGTHLGVSKQAAQQRFVPRRELGDLVLDPRALFARFTARARRCTAAAGRLGAARGADGVAAVDVVAGLLVEPEGVAARALRALGVRDAPLLDALGLARRRVRGLALSADDTDPGTLAALAFDETGEAAMRDSVEAMLRLGHGYVGTEHLLLGAVAADPHVGAALAGLGVDLAQLEPVVVEQAERANAELRAT